MDNISSQSIGKRLPYFDVLKLFAIFLVLWGHCIQYFLSSQYSDELVSHASFYDDLGIFLGIIYAIAFYRIDNKKEPTASPSVCIMGHNFYDHCHYNNKQTFYKCPHFLSNIWILVSKKLFYLLHHCILRLQLQTKKTYMDCNNFIYQPTNPQLFSTFDVSGFFNRTGTKKFRKIYTNAPSFLRNTRLTFYRSTLFLGRNFLAKTQFTGSIDK